MTFLSFALLTLNKVVPIIFGIVGAGFVIAFHELGHFLFGKLFGVSIPSFSIGFGPALFKRKIGSTIFSISLIPIGGYVEAEAGDPLNPSPNSVEAKAYWQKMCIVGGGIFFNLIFAYTVFVGVSFWGIPSNPYFSKNEARIIHSLEQNSPAEKSGLLPHDRIIKIDGNDVSKDMTALMSYLWSNPNKDVFLTIERNGKQEQIGAILSSKELNGEKYGWLGAHFIFDAVPGVSLPKALKQGFDLLIGLISETLKAFKRALSQGSTKGLSGPLVMINATAKSVSQGPSIFFLLLAFISVSLAVLNLFPLPILDGGQAVIYTIEAIIRRPLPEKIKEYVHYACWLLMIALFIYVTFKDIGRIFF